jgi:hypothetical protein
MPPGPAAVLQAAAAAAAAAEVQPALGATRLPNLSNVSPELLRQFGLAALARNPLERVRINLPLLLLRMLLLLPAAACRCCCLLSPDHEDGAVCSARAVATITEGSTASLQLAHPQNVALPLALPAAACNANDPCRGPSCMGML